MQSFIRYVYFLVVVKEEDDDDDNLIGNTSTIIEPQPTTRTRSTRASRQNTSRWDCDSNFNEHEE